MKLRDWMIIIACVYGPTTAAIGQTRGESVKRDASRAESKLKRLGVDAPARVAREGESGPP